MTESLAPACGREAVSRVLKLCSGMWIGGSPGASGLSRPSLHLRYRRRTVSPRRQRWLTTPPYDPEPCFGIPGAGLRCGCGGEADFVEMLLCLQCQDDLFAAPTPSVAAVASIIWWKCCCGCSLEHICRSSALAVEWRTAWRVWCAGRQFTAVPQAYLVPAAPAVADYPPLPLVAWSFALACGRGGSLAYPARRTGAQDAVASSSAVSAQAFELAVSRPALPSRARVTAPAPEVMALASQDQVAQSCGA